MSAGRATLPVRTLSGRIEADGRKLGSVPYEPPAEESALLAPHAETPRDTTPSTTAADADNRTRRRGVTLAAEAVAARERDLNGGADWRC